ncbi:MAG: hypothetical protein LBK67_12585 [Coriobacteriales bacterium]|jgi:hypothetical protein|nr:hypothetical protein [Coriobacteriales bacterium]
MSKKRTELLFFIGGAILVSVTVGMLIHKSDKAKLESDDQESGSTGIRKTLLQGLSCAKEKVKELSGESKIVKEISKLNKSLKQLPPDSYDASWQLVKAQSDTYVKNHPSR